MNKLMAGKLKADDRDRRASDLEALLAKKQEEKEEVQRRFDEHMQANAITEKSLHERIFDLQTEVEGMKLLRENDEQKVKKLNSKINGLDEMLKRKQEELNNLQATNKVYETKKIDMQD